MSGCQLSIFDTDEAGPATGGRSAPMVIDLTGYNKIVANDSGGKDSMCSTQRVCQLAAEQGVLDRVVIQYNKLPRVTWPGTAALGQHLVDKFGDRPDCEELVRARAAHYGVRFEVTSKTGNADLLDAIEERGMFPDASRRWCTSDFKRGAGFMLLTRLVKALGLKRPAKILYVFGFRAEESTGRRRKVAQPLVYNDMASNQTKRHVWDWYPIHDWTVEDVWADIHESGLPYHWAYDAGMSRLSCSFCILASEADLLLAVYLRPDLALAYLRVEQKIGHTFKKDLSMAEIIRRSQAKYGWELAA